MNDVRLACAVLVGLLGAASACEVDTCPSGQRQVKVQNGDGYVCLADNSADNIEPPSGATTADSGSDSERVPLPPEDGGPPPASSSCGPLDAAQMDVRVVSRDAGAPTYADAAPPDGTYDLVQANAFGASPFSSLRATIQIHGAAIFFGGQATVASLEGNESFAFAFQPGTLTKICGSEAGTLATSLFPGATGDEREAHLVWDANAKLLTFATKPDEAAYELVFAAR
ncbi:MAG TPA: hypothetical protein VIF62_20385 [Labilithrix sp.]